MRIFDNPIVMCIGDGVTFYYFYKYTYRVLGGGTVWMHAQSCVSFLYIFVLVSPSENVIQTENLHMFKAGMHVLPTLDSQEVK